LGFTSNECVAHLRVVGLIYQGLMRGCCGVAAKTVSEAGRQMVIPIFRFTMYVALTP